MGHGAALKVSIGCLEAADSDQHDLKKWRLPLGTRLPLVSLPAILLDDEIASHASHASQESSDIAPIAPRADQPVREARREAQEVVAIATPPGRSSRPGRASSSSSRGLRPPGGCLFAHLDRRGWSFWQARPMAPRRQAPKNAGLAAACSLLVASVMKNALMSSSLVLTSLCGVALADVPARPSTPSLDVSFVVQSGAQPRRYTTKLTAGNCADVGNKTSGKLEDTFEDSIRLCTREGAPTMLTIDWMTRQGLRSFHVSTVVTAGPGTPVSITGAGAKLTVSLI